MTGDYATLVPGNNFYGEDTLGWYNSEHPIMNGVTMMRRLLPFDGRLGCGRRLGRQVARRQTLCRHQRERARRGNQQLPGLLPTPHASPARWVLVYHNALLWAAGGTSGLEEKPPFSINPDFALCQSRPNPFSDRTAIRYSVPHPLDVNLAVYDLSGRLVTTLVNGKQTAGWHNVTWNRTDGEGRRVASGVYFYKLNSGTYRTTRKLVVE